MPVAFIILIAFVLLSRGGVAVAGSDTNLTYLHGVLTKFGVSLYPLTQPMLSALKIAQNVYADYGYVLVVTSTTDGQHTTGSLHYSGNAADLRIRDMKGGDAYNVAQDLSSRLGRYFGVVLESDHIHVEYQP